jgi:hypothetical protein
VVAGAVLHRSQDVVGISNFFASAQDASTGWVGCLALVDKLFDGSTLVGYESGSALEGARAHGFETVGPLRVWILDR